MANEGREMLLKSGMKIHSVNDLDEGAKMSVELSKSVKLGNTKNLPVDCNT